MKQLPKSVIISGKKYKIILDKNSTNGETNLSDGIIKIGIQNLLQVEETLLHEILEAILYERGHRYSIYPDGNDKLKFVYDHSEFENMCKDILLVLKEIKF